MTRLAGRFGAAAAVALMITGCMLPPPSAQAADSALKASSPACFSSALGLRPSAIV